MIDAQFVHDHVMHFYHLHALDWVDVVSALEADPKATSALAHRFPAMPASHRAFQRRANSVKKLVESGQLGIFANAYWGDSVYALPPEANLMAVAHYLDALAWQRQVAELHAIFGGENPHPNFLVGGMPWRSVFTPERGTGTTAVNAVGLQQVAADHRANAQVSWIKSTPGYAGDRLLLKGLVRDRRRHRQFHDLRRFSGRRHRDLKTFLIPRGAILHRDLSHIHEAST